MDMHTRRNLILDAIKPLEAVRLSAELSGLASRIKKGASPIEAITISKRMAAIIKLLSEQEDAPALIAEGNESDLAISYHYEGQANAAQLWAGEKSAWVSERKLSVLKAKITSYAKRAVKLGLPEPSLKESDERMVRWYMAAMGSKDRKAFPLTDPPKGSTWRPTDYIERQVLITLRGELPQLAGWKFAAVVEHEEHGNLVKVIDGRELPKEILSAPAYCEHCHTKRDRKATYVVRHVGNDEIRRIGGSCLKDFLGNGNANALAVLAELQSNFAAEVAADDYPPDEEFEGGGGSPYIELKEYLEAVAMCIRLSGWHSSQGSGDGMPTKDEAHSMFTKGYKGPYPEEKDKAVAASAIAWGQAITEEQRITNSFLNNCYVIAKGGAFRHKNSGIAAAIVRGYQKEQEKKREAESVGESTWQGEIGKRQTFSSLALLAVNTVLGQFGATHIHRFRDAAGNVFTWFSSSVALDAGKTYNVTASVKAHDDYKGVKQTVLTRAKAEEVPGSSPAGKSPSEGPKVGYWKKFAGGFEKAQATLSEIDVSREVHEHINKVLDMLKSDFDVAGFAAGIDYTQSLTSEYDSDEKMLRFSTYGLSGSVKEAGMNVDVASGAGMIKGGLDALVAHEFAHAIDRSIRQRGSDDDYIDWKAAIKELQSSLPAPSTYASKSDNEWVAEQFAFEFLNGYGPLEKQIRSFLLRIK